MNKKKILFIVAILAVIAIALWLIFRKPKEIALIEGQPAPVIKFPLKLGSSGYGVQQVQKYLNSKYSAGLKVDGDWGPKTNDAAILYLKRDNVSEDVYIKWGLDKI